MEIIKLRKGERGGLPCSVVGGHDGWTFGRPAPYNGAVFKLDTLEKSIGGVFVSNAQMREAGYTPDENACTLRRVGLLVEILGRDELVEFASRLNLKANGTKRDLAERIAAYL